jgi:hypothetical protein
VDSKYAKYSTEQLEVIFTHVADPAEKELVKKELSKRYYNHYLDIIKAPEAQPEIQITPEQGALSPVGAGSEEDNSTAGGQTDAYGSEATDLADIPEVAPIQMSSPATPEPACESPAKPSESAAKKKYCFIATAAYGSPLAQEVMLLQDYRDQYLSRTPLGEIFIRVYYCFSPYLATGIRHHQVLQSFARRLLTPIVLFIKKSKDSAPRNGANPEISREEIL